MPRPKGAKNKPKTGESIVAELEKMIPKKEEFKLAKHGINSKTGEEMFLVKYSKSLSDFICSKVEDGISVSEQCRIYKGTLPEERTIYRWKKKYPDFGRDLEAAYRVFFYRMIDELNDLSKAKIEGENKVEMYAEMARIRNRIDTLKFLIAKIAPKLIPELRDTVQNVQMAMPSITIVNFSPKEEKTTLIEGQGSTIS